MTGASLLVVEDDAVLNALLVRTLGRAGYEVASAQSWAQAREQLARHAPDLVLLDMGLPDSQGLEPAAQMAVDRPTVVLTANASVDMAVQAMRLGVADYLVKPVNLDELEIVIERALDSRRLRAARVVDEAASAGRRTPDLLGRSEAMEQLRRTIATVADSMVTVLVTGESGVGKELVAHAVHQAGPRRAGPFVAVDCCTLQETLFESELFGHERGAFTGADRRKPGLIEAAAGGTLFLDEIGDIGPALQSKLLRVLESGRFRRVGATTDLRADVRVVAATNRNLPAMVAAERFRADLYYRLSAFGIEVPPLRERRGDVPLLVRHFLDRFARQGRPPTIAADALERLQACHWPGNVRELRNVIERAVLMAGAEPEIGLAHFPPLAMGPGRAGPSADALAAPATRAPDAPHVPSAPALAPAPALDALIERLRSGEPTMHEIEERYLEHLLARHGGNRRRVAEVMGVSERTAYRMLDRLGHR